MLKFLFTRKHNFFDLVAVGFACVIASEDYLMLAIASCIVSGVASIFGESALAKSRGEA